MQDDVESLAEEAARGQFVDQTTINRGLLREVELGELFLIGKIRELEREADGSLAARSDLEAHGPALV